MTIWTPKYEIKPKTAKLLMAIEAAKTDIENLVISPAAEAELRRQARLRSTHYSTRIEGNKLTLAEAEEAIGDKKVSFLWISIRLSIIIHFAGSFRY